MEQWIEALQKTASQAADVLLTVEEVIFFAGVLLGVLATCLLVWAICAGIANVHVFQKAGEGGWKSIVPIYNSYITYKISWRTLWFWISALLFSASVALNYFSHYYALDIIALLVGAAGALIHTVGLYRLSKAFGHGLPFTLGLLLMHPLFILILGLGRSEYRGNPSRGTCEPAQSPAAPAE